LLTMVAFYTTAAEETPAAEGTACMEEKVAMPGNDIVKNSPEENIKTKEDCCAACKNKEGCKFFTYRQDAAKCWLKNSDAGRKADENAVSGSVDCCKDPVPASEKLTKRSDPGWAEFKQMEEMEVKDKVELTTLPFVGKEFSVSLEFLMNAIPTGTYGSILHLTLGTDCSKRGDRIPAVWVGVDGSLIVVSDLNPTNACGQGFNTISQLKDIGTGKWVKLDISQKPTERQYDANGKEMDEKYKFEVFLNGASVVSVENPEPVKYENVKVLADDSQFNYKPLDGKIRNLVIRSKDTPAPAA